MDLELIKDTVKQLNIADNEDDLTFKAAVILLCGLSENTCGYMKLKKITGYYWKEVAFILNNFWANCIIYESQWSVNLSENNLEDLIEISLCSLAGAGEVISQTEHIHPSEKPIGWDEFVERTEFCYGFATIKDVLKLSIDDLRKRNNSLRESRKILYEPKDDLIENDTPIWLLEKQQRIKQIAEKINSID
jgi:hypothetical protein